MNSKDRRKYIEELLKSNSEPQKGNLLAKELGVTRQVIVKDIAILRAEGKNIIATPEGYIIANSNKDKVRKVIAMSHKTEDIEDELSSIVKFGGTIEDVVIEHPLYGEIRGMLMIKSLFDVQNFVKRLNEYKAEPLSVLTGGVHIHTIEADSETTINNILQELKSKKYLISD